MPSWSHDSTRIAFERVWPDQIWVMKADGTNVWMLATGARTAWSPDGMKIALNDRTGTNSDIYVMNADWSGKIELTRHFSRLVAGRN